MLKRLTATLMCLMLLVPGAHAVEEGFTVRHGSREEKRICITVDDLKDTEMVEAIFNLGQELGVPMTFFTLGYVLEDEDADLWRAIAASDCEIGNHAYYHESLPQKSHQNIVLTLLRVQARLDEVLGYHYPMQVMRPPFGNTRVNASSSNMPLLRAVEEAGYKHLILWDVSENDPAKCIHKVQNGSILLFHSIHKDLHCLEVLLPQLIEQGYEFVTVSEMTGLPPIATSTDLFTLGE